jgi:L-asparaginase / beta-aspartyl-peptidase
MLTGKGAETFGKEQGMKQVPDAYFFTERRWNELLEMQAEGKAVQQPVETPDAGQKKSKARKRAALESEKIPNQAQYPDARKFGTVGAVALDAAGNLAAATSTGGMTNKKYGRVGDCPIIGSGTYANNATCAVSATGHGEYFMRSVVAHDIAAMMEYKGSSVWDAADMVVMKKLVELGGAGGVIALDAKGNIAMPFNTSGMYRGAIAVDGTVTIEIFAVVK